jgi:hypothetical protein
MERAGTGDARNSELEMGRGDGGGGGGCGRQAGGHADRQATVGGRRAKADGGTQRCRDRKARDGASSEKQ